ncbi:MAG TPA: 16S rRNA (cytosine(1402)-N(4))-methyltransferase RsmH [Chloroflexota bacterium]|nr:16S rRNA (cytosine(1402)-N(4))-methyltransferase RsmH [Chloroflexota bacterium]
MQFDHLPVLLDEALNLLAVRANADYCDVTIGGGGHAERILQLNQPQGRLLGLDVDPHAARVAAERLSHFGDRVSIEVAFFDELSSIAATKGLSAVAGILFDLGVSSAQIDSPDRGFSFRASGPLDMRLGPSAQRTAADIVNQAPEEELTRIFFEYGEERYSRRIARQIVGRRAHRPFATTDDLAGLIAAAVPRSRDRIHPATRVFQALRIAVNDELDRLGRALPQAVPLLQTGGRLVVISFHSLEDRIVKRFFRSEERGCTCVPDAPVCTCGRQPRLRILTRRPIRPGPDEVTRNPRSRSARLRAAEAVA